MHCVDLGESFQTHILLQNLASIRRRERALQSTWAVPAGVGGVAVQMVHSSACVLAEAPREVRSGLRRSPDSNSFSGQQFAKKTLVNVREILVRFGNQV